MIAGGLSREVVLRGFREVLASLGKRPLKQIGIAALVIGGASGLLMFLIASLSQRQDPRHSPEAIPPALLFGSLLALVVLLGARPKLAWLLAAVGTLAYLVFVIFLMFNTDYYGGFLRAIGYGGGIPVTVEFTEAKDGREAECAAHLMLRTNSAVIVYEEKKQTIREVPLSQVRSIRHQAGPLHQLPYALPEASSLHW
jgi:hypothetical protein